jgi:hypothetical protein
VLETLETPTASSSARWLWDGEGSSLLMGLQPLPKRSRAALGTWTFSNRLPEGPYRFQSSSESSSLAKVWGANRQTAAWCPDFRGGWEAYALLRAVCPSLM